MTQQTPGYGPEQERALKAALDKALIHGAHSLFLEQDLPRYFGLVMSIIDGLGKALVPLPTDLRDDIIADIPSIVAIFVKDFAEHREAHHAASTDSGTLQ